VAAISRELASSKGWREATLDQSRLGSATSYFFSETGGKEQLFGWAYQGAHTARTVAALNEALEMGHTAYLIDRLGLYGVDDVALLEDGRTPPLVEALKNAGFQETYTGDTASLFHRDGGPRACLADFPALGIGRGAQNLAYLFPQIALGRSNRVDDYSASELTAYRTIVLSGFDWRDRQAAEELVKGAAAGGAHVLIDLTGTPVDPLARIPRFLDVWGEQVIISNSPLPIQSESESGSLQPLGAPDALWYTHMLQGLQTEVWYFDYLGERAVLAGYNTYGSGQVWFLGVNLPYHASTTKDPVAISLISNLAGLPAGGASGCQPISLSAYRPGQDGYRFGYQLQSPGYLFLPVASLDGMQVLVDGQPVQTDSFERLLAFQAPAGQHSVEIRIHPTSIYLLGWAATAASLLGLLVLLASGKITRRST
jgi:uncharacterized membrane protein